jgi:hypothetical protein
MRLSVNGSVADRTAGSETVPCAVLWGGSRGPHRRGGAKRMQSDRAPNKASPPDSRLIGRKRWKCRLDRVTQPGMPGRGADAGGDLSHAARHPAPTWPVPLLPAAPLWGVAKTSAISGNFVTKSADRFRGSAGHIAGVPKQTFSPQSPADADLSVISGLKCHQRSPPRFVQCRYLDTPRSIAGFVHRRMHLKIS